MTDSYRRQVGPKRRSSRASESAWVLIVVCLVIEIGAVFYGASLNTGEGWSGLNVIILPMLAGVIATPLALIALTISALACLGGAGNGRRVRPWGAFTVSLLMVLYALSVLLAVIPVLGFF